jgi:hypothetical protein
LGLLRAGSRKEYRHDIELQSSNRVTVPDVCYGFWLCENTRRLGGDRTSYSCKTVSEVKLASAFNLENELKNAILAGFDPFAFLRSRGQMPKNSS